MKPEWILNNLEHLRELNASDAHKEQLKKLNADSEMIAKRLERLKKLHADPEYKAKRLEVLNKLNASESHKEQLKKLHEKNCKSVEIFDLQTEKTTTYLSIKDAAEQLSLSYDGLKSYLFLHEKKPRTKPFKGRY